MTADARSAEALTVEVFADVLCPFTHVGLRRFAARRADSGRAVRLRIRAWPLEVVNGAPLDGEFVGEEIEALRATVAPDLFTGFAVDSFPSSSLPALALAAAAYRRDPATGEAVSLELRDLLFEQGVDISDPDVLARLESRFGIAVEPGDADAVLADHAEGATRGVVGSPHFFTPDGSFFCPALDISRRDGGELRIRFDLDGFRRFFDACFG
jgi:predicted DsbA family dithiol-disulfide isomerase